MHKFLFSKLMSYFFQDCKRVGELIGEKLLITEFTAFIDLADAHEKGEISERSFYIATYALCGFANFPSIGIQIGGFGAMSPERKSDFAQIALRAMIGGCWVRYIKFNFSFFYDFMHFLLFSHY